MTDEAPRPLVRVRDASLSADGGPVRVTVSRLSDIESVADSLASAGARVKLLHGRITTTTTATRVVDATGRALGRPAAEALEERLGAAIASWHGPAPDVVTPAATLPSSERPVVMGILNVTPDSFADGGEHYDPLSHPEIAIEHGMALVEAGADLVDVGGESTRPGAEPVPEDTELKRVVPVIEGLSRNGVTVSVDTSKAAVARAAVEAGAAMINDVSGGALDGMLLPTVAELGIPYVLMHMLGTPRTMQSNPTYDDVVAEVFEFLAEGLERCADLGIDPDSVVVDPGIGFGKTVDHNLQLLRQLRGFTSLGRPVLVGTSRKSFVGRITGADEVADRMEGSIVSAAFAVARGASLVRVHDVAATVRAVRMARALEVGEKPEEA